MKTTTVNTPTNGKLNGTTVNRASIENKKEQPKVNGLPISKEFEDKKGEEEPKTEAPKVENLQPQTEQVDPNAEKAETELPKAEPSKSEIKEQLKQEKPALSLDHTIKLIETLHRRKIQRDKLLGTIGTLEAFEVAQMEEEDAEENTKFQRCDLKIGDDKGNEFSTKNPFIINAVAKYINTLCVNKLAVIEGEIFIPA
ncbi:MAG: hypothetical protein H7329_00250 [Opitutaceae bacterium]|nr:hypothetical protein [Cytophagales bacterium]